MADFRVQNPKVTVDEYRVYAPELHSLESSLRHSCDRGVYKALPRLMWSLRVSQSDSASLAL